MSLFRELKRRNVFRVAAAYVAVAWLVIQVVETLFPVFGLSDAAIRNVVILLAIGFVPAVISAWAFELTPEGFKREAEVDHDSPVSRQMTRRLDRLFIVALALALGFFAFDKFVLDPARDAQELATAVEHAREEGRIEARAEVRDSSIAVLAFQDLSPGGDHEYFGDGLAVDLIDQLGQVNELRVTGKTSAFSFKGKNVTIPQIGEALNVGHVLDGTISKSGDRIRISVQLVNARQDTQLWSQTYDRSLGDIFDIRDEITLAVFDRLSIELERLREASIRTDPGVYDLTLRARHLIFNSGVEGEKQATEMLDRALAIDPDYVPALLHSIRSSYSLMLSGLITDEEHERLAYDRIERALSIDPDNGTALGLLAWTDAEIRRDLESAARRYSDALRTAPGDLVLTRFAGMFAYSIGRHAESIALLERCVAADPNGRCLWQLVLAYLWGNRFDQALETYRRIETRSPIAGFYYLILILLLQGEPEQALEELEKVLEAAPADWQNAPQAIAARAMIMHDLGRHAESEAALQRLPGQLDENARHEAYFVAQAYAWIGQPDAAFDWLERGLARDETYGHRGFWFQRNLFLPIYRNLHDDPRWNELRERLGVSAARLDALQFTLPQWIRFPAEG